MMLEIYPMSAFTAQDNHDPGKEAYDRGDFETALKEWRPLYQLAAWQGDEGGQYMLGEMYAEGKGGSQDYVLAQMWLNLAENQGNQEAVTKRKVLEEKMLEECPRWGSMHP